MVSVYKGGIPSDVVSKFVNGVNDGYKFLLRNNIIKFSRGQFLTDCSILHMVLDHPADLILLQWQCQRHLKKYGKAEPNWAPLR